MNILQVTIQTANWHQQLAFYNRLSSLTREEKPGSLFSIKAGLSTLHVEAANKPNAPFHIAFTIPENKWEEALEFLRNQDIALIPLEDRTIFDFEDWNARSVYFHDMDGNILEFIVRYNLQHRSGKKEFTLDEAVSISEVGLVSDNPESLISFLGKEGAWPIWKKYGDDFAAIGDEEGPLIVVKEKRPWFPTNIPASEVPIRINIQGLTKPLLWKEYNLF